MYVYIHYRYMSVYSPASNVGPARSGRANMGQLCWRGWLAERAGRHVHALRLGWAGPFT